MAKKTPPTTIGFIANVGNARRGGPSAPSIIPKAAFSAQPSPKQATEWVEATELPTDEQLAAAWSRVPASVREALGHQSKNTN